MRRPVRFYINKIAAAGWARNIPEKCPQCGDDSNFLLKIYDGDFFDQDILTHECGFKKDITDYDLV